MLSTNSVQALEESLPSYKVMMADINPIPGSSTDCVNPMQKEECSKLTKLLSHDLHIGQLDGQGEEQASSAVEEKREDDDPHIMLNAYKVVNMCHCFYSLPTPPSKKI